MSLLAVQDAAVRVGLRDGALTLLRGGTVIRVVRPDEVSEVHLYGDVQLSGPATRLLLRRAVPTLFFSPKGRLLGTLRPVRTGGGQRRLAQYSAASDPARALEIARRLVAGKVENQRRLLHRVQRERPSRDVGGCVASLGALAPRIAAVDTADGLRGLEGWAAALYFRGFGHAITNPELPFTGRNRRPPRDGVNACLSFGYTVLLGRAIDALEVAGLDPYLGVFHQARGTMPALALDLVEPFRPLVVDRLVLRLVNRRQLGASDFGDPAAHPDTVMATTEATPDGASDPDTPSASEPAARAVYLGPSGRAIFLPALSRAWRGRQIYAPLNRSESLEAILRHQAVLLAQALEQPEVEYVAHLVR